MHNSRARCDARTSLDWPLSRDEKRGCVMRLYEADVRAANKLLRSKDKALHDMHKELRRASRAFSDGGGSARPRSSSLVQKREPKSPDPVLTSIDLLGIEIETAGSNAQEAVVVGNATVSSSSAAPDAAAQAERPGEKEPEVNGVFPQVLDTSNSCGRVKSRKKLNSEILPQKDLQRRARSLPMRGKSSVSSVQQGQWWAPVVKAFSKALLFDDFCPRPSTGPRPCREQFPIDFVDFEWHVELDRGEGRDQMRLGLTLELPEDNSSARHALVIAEVLEGCALYKWNCSAFPVTVRIMPVGREAVARRVLVQPGDEITKIDGEPSTGCCNEHERRQIDQRLKRCTRLTLRRRMKKPGLRNQQSFAQAGGA